MAKNFGLGIYGQSSVKIPKLKDTLRTKSHPIDILLATFYEEALSRKNEWKSIEEQVKSVEMTSLEVFGYYFVSDDEDKNLKVSIDYSAGVNETKWEKL